VCLAFPEPDHVIVQNGALSAKKKGNKAEEHEEGEGGRAE
jgi:hypothetical protein